MLGLVFVDSANKQQNERFGTLFKKDDDDDDDRTHNRTIALMPFGIPRLLGWCAEADASDFPQIEPMLPTIAAMSCRKTAFKTTGLEWEGFRDRDGEASLPKPIPLAVLSQGQVIWNQMQDELTHLSTNS